MEGFERDSLHQAMAATFDRCVEDIKAIQREPSEQRGCQISSLAYDHPAFAEGLDSARFAIKSTASVL